MVHVSEPIANRKRAAFFEICSLFVIAGCTVDSPPRLATHYNAPPGPYPWAKLVTEPYRGKQDDIFFVDAMTGWYVNGSGKIFKTVDGGKTWLLKLYQPGTFEPSRFSMPRADLRGTWERRSQRRLIRLTACHESLRP